MCMLCSKTLERREFFQPLYSIPDCTWLDEAHPYGREAVCLFQSPELNVDSIQIHPARDGQNA